MVETKRVHCPTRHVVAFVIQSSGNISVKCSLLKDCGDSCPYLKDPQYKSAFRSSPEYRPINRERHNNRD